MRSEQISIFLENKAGRLAEVTEILTDAGINIRALSLADTQDFGVLRLIVDDSEKARVVLKENEFAVGKTSVVAVEVPDHPGGLHKILSILREGNINIEYMYAFVRQSGDNAVMIFRFSDTDAAISLVRKNGFTIIEGKTLHTL